MDGKVLLIRAVLICVRQAMSAKRELVKENGKTVAVKKFTVRVEVRKLMRSLRATMPLAACRIKSGLPTVILVITAKILTYSRVQLVDTEISEDSLMRTVLVFAIQVIGVLKAAYHRVKKNVRPAAIPCIIARRGSDTSALMAIQFHDMAAVPLERVVNLVHANSLAPVESVSRNFSGLITSVKFTAHGIQCMSAKWMRKLPLKSLARS